MRASALAAAATALLLPGGASADYIKSTRYAQPGCTGTATLTSISFPYCVPDTAAGTSSSVTCSGPTQAEQRTYAGTECRGTATGTTTLLEDDNCDVDGLGSVFSECVSGVYTRPTGAAAVQLSYSDPTFCARELFLTSLSYPTGACLPGINGPAGSGIITCSETRVSASYFDTPDCTGSPQTVLDDTGCTGARLTSWDCVVEVAPGTTTYLTEPVLIAGAAVGGIALTLVAVTAGMYVMRDQMRRTAESVRLLDNNGGGAGGAIGRV